jgi:hypothetical protein
VSRASVLVISFSNICADARVLKQIRLFAEHYDVTTCGYGPAPDGVSAHVAIPDHLQAWRKDPTLLLARRYHAVYDTNEAVAYARAHLPGPGAFDVIFANDIEAVPLAVGLRPRRGVHADLHEYAPGQNTELLRWRLAVAPYVRWLCGTYVPRADSVTTVGPAIARRYARELGVHVGVVMNATPYADLLPRAVGAPIRLVHSGAGLRNRSLELMVDAVQQTSTDVTLDLFCTPNDPGYLAELRARAGVGGPVTVHDPVPYAQLVATLNGYDVGVFVLPPVNFSYRYALPNKIFDYIQARLGILIGPSAEITSLVQQRGLGVVTDGFTVDDMVRTLDALTAADVAEWKVASDDVAWDLSAEVQSVGWLNAVRAILGESVLTAAELRSRAAGAGRRGVAQRLERAS